MKKTIYLYLCGGLGNQLFQYAAAKNLAIKNNAQIVLDTNTSYSFFSHIINCINERKFKPFLKFSLHKNQLTNVKFKKYIFLFSFYRFFKKIFNLKKVFNNFNNSTLINEMILSSFDKTIKEFNIRNNLYLFGYFQSEKYFAENRSIIIKELYPQKPLSKIFINMQNNINTLNAVSIGLRLYEELNNNIINKVGGVTKLDFYKLAVMRILKDIKNPEFFIFSTKTKNVEKLLLEFYAIKQYKINIITEDEGYLGAMNNLWLMSHIKNHIISNSTLYWWAAYFSKHKFNNGRIFSSGNFANKDTCLNEWNL
jgi:hypothetical protein